MHTAIFGELRDTLLSQPQTSLYQAAQCMNLVEHSVSLNDITLLQQQREENIKRSYISLKNERQSLNNEYEAELRDPSQKDFDTDIYTKKINSFGEDNIALLQDLMETKKTNISTQNQTLDGIVAANKEELTALAEKQGILLDIIALRDEIHDQRTSIQTQLGYGSTEADELVETYISALSLFVAKRHQKYYDNVIARNQHLLWLPTHLSVHTTLFEKTQKELLTQLVTSYIRPGTHASLWSDIDMILQSYAPDNIIDCQSLYQLSDNTVSGWRKARSDLQGQKSLYAWLLDGGLDTKEWKKEFIMEIYQWLTTNLQSHKDLINQQQAQYKEQAQYIFAGQNQVFSDLYQRFVGERNDQQTTDLINHLWDLHDNSVDTRIINKSLALLKELGQGREASKEVLEIKNIVINTLESLDTQFPRIEQQQQAIAVMQDAVQALIDKETANPTSLDILNLLISALDAKQQSLQE